MKSTIRTFLAAALAVSILTISAGAADDAASGRVTFYKDVMPILQENCQICHRPAGKDMGGMIAPMSFMSYQEVRPWAKSIAKQVMAKDMPPWHASERQHGVFGNERTLTENEIATIGRWASQGAKPGNRSDSPAPIEFSSSDWAFGTPDLVMEFPEAFLVADAVEDLYHNVTIEIPADKLPEDRWVKAIQFKPGSEVVHHIIGYSYVEGEPGRDHLGGIAPGNDPSDFPKGYGMLLRKGSKFIFAMHYHKEAGEGTASHDLSRVGIQFFPKDAKVKQVVTNPIGNQGFEIPANHPDWEIGAARTFEKDTTILSLMPHAHLRAVYASYTAYYPDGRVEELLEVPKYDFNWQTSYNYDEPLQIPAGTRLEVTMKYDNSPEHGAAIGFNSDRDVSFGGPTTDEMMLGWMTYTDTHTEALTAASARADRIATGSD